MEEVKYPLPNICVTGPALGAILLPQGIEVPAAVVPWTTLLRIVYQKLISRYQL
jgi:hypothetical protein